MRAEFFSLLRKANKMRIPTFRNPHGELVYTHIEGRDWSVAQWFQAAIGELGEYANYRKKFERGDIAHHVFSAEAECELADILTYVDILALQLNTAIDPNIVRAYTTRKFYGRKQTPADWVMEITCYFGKIADSSRPAPGHVTIIDRATELQLSICGVVACLFLLAEDLELNLEDATITKFNAVSERINSPIRFLTNAVVEMGDS